MIRFMTELCPIVPGPLWLKNKSQPIAVQNVIDYLIAALDNWDGHGQVFEIGHPAITTYADLMKRYARIRGHKRGMILLPGIPIWFMAFGIGLMTPVPRPIAYALVGGLSSDSLILHDDAPRVFPEVKLIDFDSAAREALTHLHPDRIEHVWESTNRLQTLKHEGFFITHRKVVARDGTSQPFEKRWQVEVNDDSRLLLHKSNSFGEEWLEQTVAQVSDLRYYFAPRGLAGFLYWYLTYPFRLLAFY
jgi:hypothetical protein